MRVQPEFEGSEGRDARERAGRELALVGRRLELDAIAAARRRGDRAVVIVGAAGVGKTRLARAALAEADESAPLWVRATASAATIPLAAVVELLPPGTALDDPLRLFQASAEHLLARAGERRLVLGVDDAHLLDPGSAALMLHLADRGAFIVATVRSGEHVPDAVTELWKEERAHRLELAPLDEAATIALIEELLGGPVEAVAAYWAFSMSAGNALYLRELVAGAVEAGALERDGGLWRLRSRWPPGPALSELVAQRLADLGDHARLLLAAVGVGEPLSAAIAADVGGSDALALLEARNLVVLEEADGERVARLAHPLYGEVVRVGIAAERLQDVRVALARAIQAGGLRPGDALRVATWLRDAGADIEPQLLLDAAAEAYRARDPALAVELAERAAQAGHGPAAALALGQALAALGRHAEAEQALARVDDRPFSQPFAVGYLFTRINVLVWGLRDGESAERLVERAGAWWPDAGWARQVAALRMMVLSASGSLRAATDVADELAAAPAAEPLVAGLLATSGAIARLHAGSTAAALAATEHALPPAPADERLGDRDIAGLVSWSLARVEAGREWDAVDARVARIERAAVRRGDRIAAGPAAGLLGHLALTRGMPVTAWRLLREAAGHLEFHDPRGLSVVIVAQIAQAAALLGDAGAARTADAEARRHLDGRPPAWHEEGLMARSRAWAIAAAGEPSRAAEELLEQAARLEDRPLFQAQAVYDALALGAQAGRVAGALDVTAARCDAPLVAAAAHHAQALAHADADELYAAAQELAAIGARLAAATAAAEAAALGDATRPATARRAAALSARLLARCEGAVTPALLATGPASSALTRREREVAGLAAAGHSNAEIATRLVVSVRTVESHLYHAMSKLGARRRDDLGAALVRAEPQAPAQRW